MFRGRAGSHAHSFMLYTQTALTTPFLAGHIKNIVITLLWLALNRRAGACARARRNLISGLTFSSSLPGSWMGGAGARR